MGHSTQHYAINQLINAKYNSVGTRNKKRLIFILLFESHNSHHFEEDLKT